jgi:alkylation response protein AidB-like acyl-CoA dehydrogenase
MDVRFSVEQELLRASAREFLAGECPMRRVREIAEDPGGLPDALWQRMAGLGWTGLPFPESVGGSGLGLLDLAVLLEEMGKALLPGPYFSSVLLGGLTVAVGGSEAQCARWLPGLARGATRATLALCEESGSWDPDAIRLCAEPWGDGYRLSGAKHFVPDAPGADWMVVAVRTERPDGAIALLVVDGAGDGVHVEPTRLLDSTRRFGAVRFDGVVVPGDRVLPGGAEALERVLDRARVGLCAEMLGGAERVLEMSVAYARTREQFGKPIGSFQAIQHRCADMFVALEGAKSATWYAAWALEAGEPDGPLAAAMAKAYVSDAYARIAGDGIQIHGGLGFTWEQDLHLYFRRAKLCERFLGDPVWNRERVAKRLIG